METEHEYIDAILREFGYDDDPEVIDLEESYDEA